MIYKGLHGKSTGTEGQKVAEVVADTVTETVRTAAERSDTVKAAQQAAGQVSQKMKETAAEVASRCKKSAAQKATEATVIATQKAETAINSVKNGTATYQQTKNVAKQNLTHNQKKMVQNKLHQFNLETKKAEVATDKYQSELGRTVSNANGNINTAKQKANKVTYDNLDAFNKQVDETVSTAQNAVQQKQNVIDEAVKKGKKPTHKQQTSLQRAKNELVETEKKAEQAKAKAEQNSLITTIEDELKLQNALEYLENTTPEERQLQAIKNAYQHEKALNRKFNKKLNQPKYQRQIRDLQRKENPSLEKIANNDKDPIIREIAAEILAIRNV